jgi:hypothetical protein
MESSAGQVRERRMAEHRMNARLLIFNICAFVKALLNVSQRVLNAKALDTNPRVSFGGIEPRSKMVLCALPAASLSEFKAAGNAFNYGAQERQRPVWLCGAGVN